MKKLFYIIFIGIVIPLWGMAQSSVSGKIVDSDGLGLVAASIIETGTTNGTYSDGDGNFTLNLKSVPTNITITFLGFNTETRDITKTTSDLVITLNEEGTYLDELIVIGTRGKPRTALDSPVPIDNIKVGELRASGKPIIERMLTFKVPSFNSQNQAISDATAHYDPADLRGLGPSRTLVLVNGKRKNQSAQVYLNRTPGKGEVGIDLKSIPTAAIERVEVLRDGASAQYGSDAIAGVINMVLKKDIEYSTLGARTGITSQGDGFFLGTDFNKAFTVGDDGYANLTLGYYNQGITNRAGEPGLSDLPDDARPNEIKFVEENPDIGMHVGQPELEKVDFFINAGHPIGEDAEFYTFHGFTTRTGKSFAYYRAPYWRRDVADAEFLTDTSSTFIGYQPTFETDIKDHINAIGINFEKFGFNGDVSATYGSNSVNYLVNNSVNRDLLAATGYSPTSFNPGGYKLSNIIGNIDLSKELTSQLNLAIGGEYKKEFFNAYEGEKHSYYGGGSDSFAGIKPEEAGEWDRNSVAGYAQLDFDITESLLVGVAGRYEDFSDFGDNFSYKVNGRFKIGQNGAIRASYSTGFRAPTLHQRHLTNSQYIIVAGSPEPLLQGTLSNDNAAVKALGVESLFAETSQNISAGATYKLNNNLSITADFYQINVDDRVLFSSQISGNDDGVTDAVEQILEENGVVAVQFFINAGDTKTTGADFVLNYNSDFGLKATLAANINETTIDAITTPEILANTGTGYNIFSREEQGLITNSRPRSKFILGLGYDIAGFVFNLNNTLFGPVTVTAPEAGFGTAEGGIDQELSSQLVTDLSIGYNLAGGLNVYGMVNNIFDAYPDITLASTNTAQAGGRFLYSSEVQQQGQLGTNFTIGFNYNF